MTGPTTREVQCGPEDFRPLIMSEAARGNKGGRWVDQPPSTPSYHFDHPLDLDAIRAEFDLPGCLQLNAFPDGRTSVGCELTRVSVGGGPKPPGRRAARAREAWWDQQQREPRPRKVFAPRDDA